MLGVAAIAVQNSLVRSRSAGFGGHDEQHHALRGGHRQVVRGRNPADAARTGSRAMRAWPVTRFAEAKNFADQGFSSLD